MAYFKARVSGSSGNEPVLLWTNPSPTSAFAAQTIALDLTGYEALLIETWYGDNQSTGYMGKQVNYVDLILLTDEGNNKYSLGSASSSSTWHASRLLTLSSSGLKLTNSGRFNADWGESHNEKITTIPVKIYGLKKRILDI